VGCQAKLLLFALLLGAGTALADMPAEDPEVRLQQARQRLDDAARELADLQSEIGAGAATFVSERRGVLGIVLGAPEGDGVRLLGVAPGSGAEAAGLMAGDVIVAVAGSPVAGSIPNLTRALETPSPGDVVAVEYLRGSERASADVTIAEPRVFQLPLPPPDGMGMGGVAVGVAMASTEAPTLVQFAANGLQLHDLDASLGRYFGVGSGVLVLQSAEGSGLEGGDVLLAIADAAGADAAPQPIRNAADAFGRLMRAADGVSVTVLRDGGERTVDFVAGTVPTPPDQLVPLHGEGRIGDGVEVHVFRSE
jgi:PDZ domain